MGLLSGRPDVVCDGRTSVTFRVILTGHEVVHGPLTALGAPSTGVG